ncbi:MAG: hypothetical protein Q9M13_06675, partial [Mariprofundales bacterium]|nr:hypothetical protein [Mariprofundales bacterium]
LTVLTEDAVCQSRGTIDFTMTGSKLIGQDPDVIKYDRGHTTDALGSLVLDNLEWDTYDIALTSANFYLTGSLPSLPMTLAPGSDERLELIVDQKTPVALLVEVLDIGTGLPIEKATVTLTGPGYANTLYTGEGYWQQTDWSGGPGQSDFTDSTRFFEYSMTLDIDNPAGELRLRDQGASYASSGWLVSSTFDNATSTNFYHLTIRPQDQPQQTGTDPVRVQIASNNDNSTWNFIGPDGTANTYYTPANQTLYEGHNGDRYIRYRVTLQTEDTSFTPNVSDIAISFASECTPSGQAYFNDVGTGEYTITINKDGYKEYTDTLNLQSGWQKTIAHLEPL